jgi:hypothetical protein
MRADRSAQWLLKGDPIVGEVIKAAGREYEVVDYGRIETATGRATLQFALRGTCDRCGTRFTFPARRMFWPTAKCEGCR